MKYEQAFKDWKYLWNIGAADDMTGAYVDQEDLDKLLHSPTKATAAHCLCRQIEYWFDTGPDTSDLLFGSYHDLVEQYPGIPAIMERHAIYDTWLA